MIEILPQVLLLPGWTLPVYCTLCVYCRHCYIALNQQHSYGHWSNLPISLSPPLTHLSSLIDHSASLQGLGTLDSTLRGDPSARQLKYTWLLQVSKKYFVVIYPRWPM